MSVAKESSFTNKITSENYTTFYKKKQEPNQEISINFI